MQRERGIGCGGRWYPWEKVGYLSYPDDEKKDDQLKITPVDGHWFESMSVPWREIVNADLVHSVSAHGLKPGRQVRVIHCSSPCLKQDMHPLVHSDRPAQGPLLAITGM